MERNGDLHFYIYIIQELYIPKDKLSCPIIICIIILLVLYRNGAIINAMSSASNYHQSNVKIVKQKNNLLSSSNYFSVKSVHVFLRK